MTKKEIKHLDKLLGQIVKEKVNYSCEKCGRQTTSIQPHHIFSRSNRSVRWDTDNIVVLCSGCHTLCNDSAHKAPMEFREFLLDKRGKIWYNKLRKKAKQLAKHQNFETILEELKEIENE